MLAQPASVERIVEHHGKQLDRTTFPGHANVYHLAESGTVLRAQWPATRLGHGPPGDETDARHPVLLLPVTNEPVMSQAQPSRDPAGLSRVALAPGLNQADQVGCGLLECLFQRGLTCFAVRAIA